MNGKHTDLAIYIISVLKGITIICERKLEARFDQIVPNVPLSVEENEGPYDKIGKQQTHLSGIQMYP